MYIFPLGVNIQYLKNLNTVRASVKIEIDGQDVTQGVSLVIDPSTASGPLPERAGRVEHGCRLVGPEWQPAHHDVRFVRFQRVLGKAATLCG